MLGAGEESYAGSRVVVDEAISDDAVLSAYNFQAVETCSGKPTVLHEDSSVLVGSRTPEHDRTRVARCLVGLIAVDFQVSDDDV